MSKQKVNFADFSEAEKQAWVEFVAHEKQRHIKDIEQIVNELLYIKETHGIEPKGTYVDVWIEVKP